MRLIITRHGETVENVNGISQGHNHGTLTENGIMQAKKLALRLKDEKIDAIYSSDLGRAANTAKEVAKYHPHLKVSFTKLLRERDTREFAGKKCTDINWYDDSGEVETDNEMMERAQRIIDEAYEKHSKGSVLLLGHGGVNAAIMSVIMNKTIGDIFGMAEWDNTNVTIFEINEDKSHKISCMNCTRHLEQNN